MNTDHLTGKDINLLILSLSARSMKIEEDIAPNKKIIADIKKGYSFSTQKAMLYPLEVSSLKETLDELNQKLTHTNKLMCKLFK